MKRTSRAAGFSLAEVLVAVALLGVILLALMGLISSGVHRAYSGKKMTEGTMLAQAAMERANVYAAWTLLGVAKTAEEAEITWTKTGPTASGTTPATVTGTSAEAIEKTAWHDLLASADLPATSAFPATLKISMKALPEDDPDTAADETSTFEDASMVRVVVDVNWTEWGTRARQVRLQTLNLRTTP
jgi:prepilin-type N-terminal cleavage/methylation domain-containing protein